MGLRDIESGRSVLRDYHSPNPKMTRKAGRSRKKNKPKEVIILKIMLRFMEIFLGLGIISAKLLSGRLSANQGNQNCHKRKN